MRIVNPKISTRADWEKSWGGGFYTKDSSAGNQACQDRANYINKTLEHLGVTPQVLADVGCGNGMFAQALLEYYPNTRMIMIDWSTTALNIAKERLSGFIERCIFIQQDTSKLEAPIDADVFLSMGVIEHYDDPLAQLDILVRQMPDHAYLVLMTPNSRSMVVASRWILQLRKKFYIRKRSSDERYQKMGYWENCAIILIT